MVADLSDFAFILSFTRTKTDDVPLASTLALSVINDPAMHVAPLSLLMVVFLAEPVSFILAPPLISLLKVSVSTTPLNPAPDLAMSLKPSVCSLPLKVAPDDSSSFRFSAVVVPSVFMPAPVDAFMLFSYGGVTYTVISMGAFTFCPSGSCILITRVLPLLLVMM